MAIWNVRKAKVKIDGKEGYRAFAWHLYNGSGDDADMTACVSCYGLEDKPRLSLKDNPNPVLTLIDGCGIELEYATKLVKIETSEKVGAVLQIDYFFKIQLEQ